MIPKSFVTLVSDKGPQTPSPIFKTLVTLAFKRVYFFLMESRIYALYYVCVEQANVEIP